MNNFSFDKKHIIKEFACEVLNAAYVCSCLNTVILCQILDTWISLFNFSLKPKIIVPTKIIFHCTVFETCFMGTLNRW